MRRARLYTYPMKSIGPYVILATSHGAGIHGVAGTSARADGQQADRKAEPGDSAPLHALDRLTGMPVLLHRLAEVVIPVALPDSASLLPVSEVAVWDGQVYAVTELPPTAVPALHPDLAALGALRGLAALHGAGQIHGGLNAGQLWRLGREVRLAGAGLPWPQGAGAGLQALEMQALDMHALGRTLDTLGVRPAPIASLETMSASQALQALESALAEQERQKASATSVPTSSVAPKSVVVRPKPEPSAPPKKVPADPVPTPLPPVTPLPAPSVPSTPLVPSTSPASSPAGSAPETEQLPSGDPALDAPSRYRAADEVVVLGEAPAPAEAHPSPAVAQVAGPLPSVTRAVPIRIGFDEPPAPLPDWKSSEQTESGGEEQNDREAGPEGEGAPLGPATLDNDSPATASAVDGPEKGGPEQTGVSEPIQPVAPHSLPAEAETSTTGAASPSPAARAVSTLPGTVPPANRSQPLRIGWEEDHSWRVVKSGPERRRIAAPQLSSGTPRILLLVLALLVGAGVWYWSSGRKDTSAPGCCTQTFTVSGSSGPVKVTLLVAPPGSPLQPGALIGTAPGSLKFPNVPGSYTLKFSAAGHAAMTSTVNVPSARPFGIVLK
jgi:hypothetical protein